MIRISADKQEPEDIWLWLELRRKRRKSDISSKIEKFQLWKHSELHKALKYCSSDIKTLRYPVLGWRIFLVRSSAFDILLPFGFIRMEVLFAICQMEKYFRFEKLIESFNQSRKRKARIEDSWILPLTRLYRFSRAYHSFSPFRHNRLRRK